MTSTLYTEIQEQPAVLARLLANEAANITAIADAIRQRAPKQIILAARGSSDNAARYAQYAFGILNGINAGLSAPSILTLYKGTPDYSESVVIAVSQSGQSPDIIGVIMTAKAQGALTIVITNDTGSPLAKVAGHVIALHAGQEVSIAATKTYTASLLALAMLAAAISGEAALQGALSGIPAWAAIVSQNLDAFAKTADRYSYIEKCVVTSRGYNYATAYEIALKLKELTYILAEPYSSADFQHGPVAIVEHGFPVFAVVPDGVVAEELIRFLSGLRDRGAELIIASPLKAALELAHTPLPLPTGVPEWLSPIPAVIAGQAFTYGLTLGKRLDPDHPRGLRKVTLTR